MWGNYKWFLNTLDNTFEFSLFWSARVADRCCSSVKCSPGHVCGISWNRTIQSASWAILWRSTDCAALGLNTKRSQALRISYVKSFTIHRCWAKSNVKKSCRVSVKIIGLSLVSNAISLRFLLRYWTATYGPMLLVLSSFRNGFCLLILAISWILQLVHFFLQLFEKTCVLKLYFW